MRWNDRARSVERKIFRETKCRKNKGFIYIINTGKHGEGEGGGVERGIERVCLCVRETERQRQRQTEDCERSDLPR